jgi:transposase InsO family protein
VGLRFLVVPFTTALLFLKEVWKHHRTPRVVVSDRGPQFIAGFTCELYKLLGIKLAMSTAYHPQTDSQTERVNQVLEGYLCTFTGRRQVDWDGVMFHKCLTPKSVTIRSYKQQK